MIVLTILYVFFISVGIIGVGYFLWKKIRQKADSSSESSYKEHFFLTLSIAWLLGYFAYEGLLYLLAVSHMFYAPVVIALGVLLSFLGWGQVVGGLKISSIKRIDSHPLELIMLAGMLVFVFFWNLYPTFDVDSLSNYFPVLQIFLENHGVYFSHYNDVRFAFPLGENMMSVLGFAWWRDSTFFAQLMQGFSKIMFLAGLYGAGRSLGLGTLSLIVPALVVSEEHFIASGANQFVHINVILTHAVCFLFYGLIVFCEQKKRSYLLLAMAALGISLLCKYIGLVYLIIFGGVIGMLMFLREDICQDLGNFLKTRFHFLVGFILVVGSVTIIPYVLNWLWSGTPIFPISVGPLHSSFYDAHIRELGSLWHYHLSLSEAFKNFSAFMVWPGMLPSKILVPLAFGAGILQFLLFKRPSRLFGYAMAFFVLSMLMVILQEWYIVYEMRYYRFGIGIYALSCALFIGFIGDTIVERLPFLRRAYKILGLLLSFLVIIYCVRDSFDVMGNARPSKGDIVAFLTSKHTEPEIFKERYEGSQKVFEQFRKLNLPEDKVGLFIPVSWPQTIYPLRGKTLSFFKSSAFPTYAYFDQYAMAKELMNLKIQYVVDLVSDTLNPWQQGIWGVFNHCGKPLLKGSREFLELSPSCLEDLASRSNEEVARNKVEDTLSKLRNKEKYNPFQKPEYGGFGGFIK